MFLYSHEEEKSSASSCCGNGKDPSFKHPKKEGNRHQKVQKSKVLAVTMGARSADAGHGHQNICNRIRCYCIPYCCRHCTRQLPDVGLAAWVLVPVSPYSSGLYWCGSLSKTRTIGFYWRARRCFYLLYTYFCMH